MTGSDAFDALRDEQEALEAMLDSLDDAAWGSPSLCPGWSVADVVLHLGQTEEAVVASADGATQAIPAPEGVTGMDELVEHWVSAERGSSSSAILDRWKAARRKALEALLSADPEKPMAWAAAPLKPRTLATTRLSEHWIHANDIAQPLQLTYPDTDRLWHIAWLAHKTVPYAFLRAGRENPPSVRLELTSPGGERWDFGPEDADCIIGGPASQFCRVAGRRLTADEADRLQTSGDGANGVLELVRTYA
ncbi:MAG: maleylpyruvate isomerase family mycothiol-dependent enzyme [Actinomycetota bacterium]